MKDIGYKLFLSVWLVLWTVFLMACGSGGDSLTDEKDSGSDDDQKTATIEPVSELAATKTDKANELRLEWKNPSNIVTVEIFNLLNDFNPSTKVPIPPCACSTTLSLVWD